MLMQLPHARGLAAGLLASVLVFTTHALASCDVPKANRHQLRAVVSDNQFAGSADKRVIVFPPHKVSGRTYQLTISCDNDPSTAQVGQYILSIKKPPAGKYYARMRVLDQFGFSLYDFNAESFEFHVEERSDVVVARGTFGCDPKTFDESRNFSVGLSPNSGRESHPQ